VKWTAVNCLLKHSLCMMSHHKSSLNGEVTMTCFHLHDTAVYKAEAILSSKASYLVEMLITDVADCKWRWPWNPLKSSESCTHHTSISTKRFPLIVFFLTNLVSQIKYWSWKYSRSILQYRDHKYQDKDQDHIILVWRALDTETGVSTTTFRYFHQFNKKLR